MFTFHDEENFHIDMGSKCFGDCGTSECSSEKIVLNNFIFRFIKRLNFFLFAFRFVSFQMMYTEQCAPKPKREQRYLDVFADLEDSVSNFVNVTSNRIESAVNRTANILETMSNTLWETLRTRDKLQLLDQTEKLGGKLSNASTNFLEATSATFVGIFNSTYETLNSMFATQRNISNQFTDVTTNFVSQTGNLVSSWLDIQSSMPSTQSDDQKMERNFIATNLLVQSIGLVNRTNESLAKVINATSFLMLDTSMENKAFFVGALINSTARILNVTTASLGILLDSTNHLIEDVVNANQETVFSAYNATTKLLNAVSETVTSFLKATTLLIGDAANSTMLGNDADESTIRAMHATKNIIQKIFNSTTTLMRGIIDKQKHAVNHVVDTTENFLEASFDIKSNIFDRTIIFSENVKNATVNLVANKLQSAANKLVSALEYMEQHFESNDSIQSKPQVALDQVEQEIDPTQLQSESSFQLNDAQASEVISPEIIKPVEVQTEPIIQIENQTELNALVIENESMQPAVDSRAEPIPSVV